MKSIKNKKKISSLIKIKKNFQKLLNHKNKKINNNSNRYKNLNKKIQYKMNNQIKIQKQNK